jgi:hypothetical protein
MIVAHTVNHLLAVSDTQLLAMSQHVEAAGFLQIIKRTVLGFLAIVFFIGGLIGFFNGKAFGKRG